MFSIPSFLARLEYLKSVRIQLNHALIGSIPEAKSYRSEVSWVSLDSQFFSIPSFLARLEYLKSIRIQLNQALIGSIPWELGNTKSLEVRLPFPRRNPLVRTHHNPALVAPY